jgi:hypothetical protein
MLVPAKFHTRFTDVQLENIRKGIQDISESIRIQLPIRKAQANSPLEQLVVE